MLGWVIGGWILILAWKTVKPAVLRLMDRQDAELAQQVAALLRRQRSVEVDRVRARRLGSTGADIRALVCVTGWAPDAARLQELFLEDLASTVLHATVDVQLRVKSPSAAPPSAWRRECSATPNASPASAWRPSRNPGPASR